MRSAMLEMQEKYAKTTNLQMDREFLQCKSIALDKDMVLILDGNSEIGAQVSSKIGYLIC